MIPEEYRPNKDQCHQDCLKTFFQHNRLLPDTVPQNPDEKHQSFFEYYGGVCNPEPDLTVNRYLCLRKKKHKYFRNYQKYILIFVVWLRIH